MTLLRPTPAKVALSLLLVALSYVIQSHLGGVPDYWAYGYPLRFYEFWGPCPSGQTCQAFNPSFLFLDVVFWYLIGALVLLPFRRSR